MSKVIAIGNNKGGVAKTTTAVNLAKGLSDDGMRVLLIDADPQGNATAAVGYDEPDAIEDTLASVMIKEIKDEEIEPGFAILHNEGGFDVLPGNIELSELEALLVNVMDRERVLKQFITMIRPMYDYIIVDCAPSLGTITTNAFVAADSVGSSKPKELLAKMLFPLLAQGRAQPTGKGGNSSGLDKLLKLYKSGKCYTVLYE